MAKLSARSEEIRLPFRVVSVGDFHRKADRSWLRMQVIAPLQLGPNSRSDRLSKK